MAHLVVGQVSKDSARIWVHGPGQAGAALLRHRVRGSSTWLGTHGAPFLDHLGHVAVFDLEGLAPATAYECELACGGARVSATGSFTTASEGSRPRDGQ